MKHRTIAGRGIAAVFAILTVACAGGERENFVDPVNVPRVEMVGALEFDGSAIVVEWRYLTEGSSLESFSITRSAGETATEVGRVSVASAAGADWTPGVFRDSTLVAGIRLRYTVTSILADGTMSTSAWATIRIDGAQFALDADPAPAHVALTWRDEPAATVGFEVLRSENGAPAVSIFLTDDPTVLSFDDTSVVGNTMYAYELVTILDGGAELRSSKIEASLYTHFRTVETDPKPTLGSRHMWDGEGIFEVAGDEVLRTSMFIGGNNNVDRIRSRVSFESSDLSTVSAHPPTPQNSVDDGYSFYVGGLSPDNSTVFLHAYAPDPSVVFPDLSSISQAERDRLPLDWLLLVEERTWPSSGGDRTGFTVSGNDLFFYEGETLRLLDRSLNVVAETVVPDGEPIDIAYQDESIWLVYPDRMIRSTEPLVTPGMSWIDIPIPEGATLSAITSFRDQLVLLDAVNAKLYLVDTDGRVALSWDALGSGLDRGDVAIGRNGRWFVQIDGDGTIYLFDPDGPPDAGGN